MTGELDGQSFEFERERRKRFALTQEGRVLVTAECAKRGRCKISVGERAYQLTRRSALRSEMQLREGQATIGSIRRAARRKVLCELPPDISPPSQAFIAFLVITLWARAVASSGAAAGAGSSA